MQIIVVHTVMKLEACYVINTHLNLDCRIHRAVGLVSDLVWRVR